MVWHGWHDFQARTAGLGTVWHGSHRSVPETLTWRTRPCSLYLRYPKNRRRQSGVKITGLDKLSRKLDELSKFAKEIDGHLGEVKFNPRDPGEIERAIAEMETMVDEKASSYSHNDAIQNIADQMKEKYRQAILDKAAASRLEDQS